MGRVASMEFNVSAGILRAKCFSFLIRILKFRLGLSLYYFAVVLSSFVLFLLVFVGRLAVRDTLDCMYYFFNSYGFWAFGRSNITTKMVDG